MTSPSALITGVATGIGASLAGSLAQKGYSLTLLDIDQKGLQRTAQDVRSFTNAQVFASVLDVTDTTAQDAAVRGHMDRYGRVDVAVLNAGIGERGDVFSPTNKTWQPTLDVDLTAVLHGIRSVAISMMAQHPPGGTIVCVASAGAIFPILAAPVYAAAKAGLLHFIRSAAPRLARKGVRLIAVCPEFVDTPLVRNVMVNDPTEAKRLLGSLDIKLLPPSAVSDLIMKLVEDKQQDASVVLLRQDGRIEYPYLNSPSGKGNRGKTDNNNMALRTSRAAWAKDHRGNTYKKWQIHTLSSDFHKAARLINAPLHVSVPPGHLLVKRVWVGINASDINYSAGRYHGSPRAAQARLPFDCGFESVNVVAAVGEGVTGLSPGDSVASLTYDGFSEYSLLKASQALQVPSPCPEVVALLTSGLTASIALEECGPLLPGQTVLVTAAAGGTGQFAVQLAHLAKCHVIATAGGPDKVKLCQQLGADRVVDYKSSKLQDVLKQEYRKGVDLVYESVGGDMFSAAVDNLADKGKIIIIGMMSSYAEGWPTSHHPGLTEKLLWKSASLHGFFLLRYAHLWKSHLSRLLSLWQSGKLVVALDPEPFVGLEQVPAAIDRLQSGRSFGKVVVRIPDSLPEGATATRYTAHETRSKL